MSQNLTLEKDDVIIKYPKIKTLLNYFTKNFFGSIKPEPKIFLNKEYFEVAEKFVSYNHSSFECLAETFASFDEREREVFYSFLKKIVVTRLKRTEKFSITTELSYFLVISAIIDFYDEFLELY